MIEINQYFLCEWHIVTMRTHRVVQASKLEPVEELFNEGDSQDVEIPEPSQKRRRTKFRDVIQKSGPEFKVYCPCHKCDARSKPTLRLVRICVEHIVENG